MNSGRLRENERVSGRKKVNERLNLCIENYQRKYYFCSIDVDKDIEMDQSHRPTTVIDLNEDCLRHVFQYIDLDDFCAINNVCYWFRNVAQVHFSTKIGKTLDFAKILQNQRDFESVERLFVLASKVFYNFGDIIESIRISEISSPRGVWLSNAWSQLVVHVTALIGRYCSGGNLKELTLYLVYVTDDVAGKLQPVFRHLRRLTLKGNPSEGFLKLLFHQPWHLDTVSFQDMGIVNMAIKRILRNNSQSQMKTLVLKDCVLSDDTISSIADYAPYIEYFHIEGCRFSARNGNYEHLCKLSNLKGLETDINGAELCAAINAMAAVNVPLEHLKVRFNTTHVPLRVVEEMSKLKSLKSLSLVGKSQMSASNVIDMIENLSNLTKLQLADVCDLNPKDVLNLVRKMGKLQILDIRYSFEGHIDTDIFMKIVENVRNRRGSLTLKMNKWTIVPNDLFKTYSDFVMIE